MDKMAAHKLLSGLICVAAILLVGLTLYTAYFGVFPDGIQRSAHLLLVMTLVFAAAFRMTLEPGAAGGTGVMLQRGWIILALIGALVATGHQFFNFDSINDRYGAITQYEIIFGTMLVIVLFDACRRTIGLPIVLLASLFILNGSRLRFILAGAAFLEPHLG
jgi:TRAP-type uncharacterized transport system fused permease subunit